LVPRPVNYESPHPCIQHLPALASAHYNKRSKRQTIIRGGRKFEKGKWTEDVEERTFMYGGYEFVWGEDNQDAKETRLLNWIITVTNNNNKKRTKNNCR
jgi:hypothetical protein